MIAFLDASVLIYLTEGTPRLAAKVRAQLQAREAAAPGLRLAVSRLALLECRVAPLRDGDTALLVRYDAFFVRSDLIVVELDANVIDLATAIRARHGLKTPDALHAACCLQLGPEHVFVTGDKGFGRVSGLRVQVVG